MKSLKIIAIEDDIDFGDVLEMRLKSWGHDVTLVRNWLTMMMTISSQSFDVIIADVETPTGNGLTALQFLDKEDGVHAIRKVFLTGLNDAETIHACEAMDAKYIHKSPTALNELKDVLAEIANAQEPVSQ